MNKPSAVAAIGILFVLGGLVSIGPDEEQDKRNSLTDLAHDKCAEKIASFLGAKPFEVPRKTNFGQDENFYFGYGTFQVNYSGGGSRSVSASCDGSLNPVVVRNVSVNGILIYER